MHFAVCRNTKNPSNLIAATGLVLQVLKSLIGIWVTSYLFNAANLNIPHKSTLVNPFTCLLEAHRQTSDKLHTDHEPMHFCVGGLIFCKTARGLNGFGSRGCFRGRGNCDCTSRRCSDPVTGFALEGHVSTDPFGKIVAMTARRHNELMNHDDTPRLKPISVSIRTQREGGTRREGGGAQTSCGTQVADRSQV